MWFRSQEPLAVEDFTLGFFGVEGQQSHLATPFEVLPLGETGALLGTLGATPGIFLPEGLGAGRPLGGR